MVNLVTMFPTKDALLESVRAGETVTVRFVELDGWVLPTPEQTVPMGKFTLAVNDTLPDTLDLVDNEGKVHGRMPLGDDVIFWAGLGCTFTTVINNGNTAFRWIGNPLW